MLVFFNLLVLWCSVLDFAIIMPQLAREGLLGMKVYYEVMQSIILMKAVVFSSLTSSFFHISFSFSLMYHVKNATARIGILASNERYPCSTVKTAAVLCCF